LVSAHLFRCAAAIAALPALLIFRRLRRGNSEVALVDWEPPSSICRISAIQIWTAYRSNHPNAGSYLTVVIQT
jgi:hypothetical protein